MGLSQRRAVARWWRKQRAAPGWPTSGWSMLRSGRLRRARPGARIAVLAGLALLAACTSAPVRREPGPPRQGRPPHPSARAAALHLEPVGMARLPTGLTFQGTEVGGLSAITYDASWGVYYALSDDRSERSPARFYTLQLDLDDGFLAAGDVRVVGVTVLQAEAGKAFAPGTVDPEGLALATGGRLFVSSEGHADRGIPPFVREVGLDGSYRRSLAVPGHYLPSPDGTAGVRDNLGFEPLTLAPPGRGARVVVTASENALAQDGPAAEVGQGSPCRILRLDLETGEPLSETLYWTEPVAEPPAEPDGFRTNGLTELLALGEDRFLALERSYSDGAGFTVRLFQISLKGATELMGRGDLSREDLESLIPVAKTLVLDLGAAGLPLDNLEGMTLGPTLPDGRPSLVLVSDNNFNAEQVTLFLAFALSE